MGEGGRVLWESEEWEGGREGRESEEGRKRYKNKSIVSFGR